MTSFSPPPITMILFVLAFIAIISLMKGRGEKSAPALVAKPFLTAREREMLVVIEALLPEHRIHAQVAMGALMKPARIEGRRSTPAERNRFSQKIIDFVVQSRQTGDVVALIEVDDRSHRASADEARDAMTAQAGYRTIRIPANVRPVAGEVEARLDWLLPRAGEKLQTEGDLAA